jgi:type I restriction enzyme M protein
MGEKLASLLKQQYPEGIDAGVDFKDRTQAAFVVPKADIAAQKYDLSIVIKKWCIRRSMKIRR